MEELENNQQIYITQNDRQCIDQVPNKDALMVDVHQIYYFLNQEQATLDACVDCTEIDDQRDEIDA